MCNGLSNKQNCVCAILTKKTLYVLIALLRYALCISFNDSLVGRFLCFCFLNLWLSCLNEQKSLI